MAGETAATFRGTVHGDPELRYTPSGAPVARFLLASIRREYDREAKRWYDAEPLFVVCTVWRELAENIAEALQGGVHVVATGALAVRETGLFLDATDVGISLRQRIAYTESTMPPALAKHPTPAPVTRNAPSAPETEPTKPTPAPAASSPEPEPAANADSCLSLLDWHTPERSAQWQAITAPRPRPWAVPC